jgi:hypothetical protein
MAETVAVETPSNGTGAVELTGEQRLLLEKRRWALRFAEDAAQRAQQEHEEAQAAKLRLDLDYREHSRRAADRLLSAERHRQETVQKYRAAEADFQAAFQAAARQAGLSDSVLPRLRVEFDPNGELLRVFESKE